MSLFGSTLFRLVLLEFLLPVVFSWGKCGLVTLRAPSKRGRWPFIQKDSELSPGLVDLVNIRMSSSTAWRLNTGLGTREAILGAPGTMASTLLGNTPRRQKMPGRHLLNHARGANN